ncbi:MAG: LysR family transcriptional regulator [Myxococcota bacterium]
MNLAKLRSLVAVAKHGSFTRAAKSMALSQSAVSKTVAEVEQDLGFAVFERTARGVILTQAGEDFVDRAARLFADFDLLLESAERQRGEGEGRLRYGVAPPSLVGLLNRPVLELVKTHPNLSLECHAVGMARGLELLRRGDVDVLVGPDVISSDVPELTKRVIQPRFVSAICARRGHPLGRLERVEPKDLVKYPFIFSTSTDLYVDRFFSELTELAKEAFRTTHVLDNPQLLISVLEASDALAVFSEGYARSSAVRRRLDILAAELEPLTLVCTYRRRWLATSPMRWFMEALERDPPS